MFDPLRPALADQVRLLTPDLRGFGTGPGLADPPPVPDLRLLAADVIGELDAAGIDQAIIGGVSMGGYVCFAVLRAYPERVAGLVLADTRSGADDAAALERRRTAADRADRGEIPGGLDAIAPLIAGGTVEATRAALADIAGGVPAATIAWGQRAMAARADSTEVLAGAQVPVLVVVGEKDGITPPPVARQLADTAQQAELVQLPGVCHLSPAEDPAGFAAALLSWLSRHF